MGLKAQVHARVRGLLLLLLVATSCIAALPSALGCGGGSDKVARHRLRSRKAHPHLLVRGQPHTAPARHALGLIIPRCRLIRALTLLPISAAVGTAGALLAASQ